jgi:hypothetical protein
MRLFVLFNLKPGVALSTYETWAKSRDLPTVNALPSVSSFRVFKTTGRMGSDEAAPYSHIEIIDIDDIDKFGKDVASETMQTIAAEFMSMADVIFLSTEELK